MEVLSSKFKRKQRKSSSDSEVDETNKKSRLGSVEVVEEETISSSSSGSSNMADELSAKLDLVLKKLTVLDTKTDGMSHKLTVVEQKAEAIECKVNGLQQDFMSLREGLKKTNVQVQELEKGMEMLEAEVQQMRAAVRFLEEDAVGRDEIESLRQEKLYLEVYTRRENLRFYGIPETSEDGKEDSEEVLQGFLSNKLGMTDAGTIEYQRVHRIGKFSKDQAAGKPRPIIARFLRYPDREDVFSHALQLEKGTGFGVSPDLPKAIVERRKVLLPKLKEAKKANKKAYFSRSEPDKLYIAGVLQQY